MLSLSIQSLSIQSPRMKPFEFKSLVQDAKIIVVKVGSSLVTNDGHGLDQAAIAAWAWF